MAGRWARYSGYLAVCAAYAVVAWGLLREKAPFRAPGAGSGLWAAISRKSWVVACDLASFVLPVRLSVEYGAPVPEPWAASLLSLCILAAFGILVRGLFSKRWRFAAFGGLWFLITLIPVSGLYPIFNLRADRYLYLPSMGLCLAAACLFDRIPAGSARLILPVALVCVLGALTAFRSTAWRDNFILWSDAVRKAPSSARAHTILGNALLDRGDRRAAFREYRRAIALDPRFVDAYNDLGTLLCEERRYEDAIRAFQWAIVFYPRHPEAHHNLGYTYREMGRPDDAEREFRRALELNPGLAHAHLQLAFLYAARAEEMPARRELTRALDLNPDLLPSAATEATRAAGRGDRATASRVLQLAGEAYLEGGRCREAASSLREALRLEPDLLEARNSLGAALAREGDYAGARREWEAALARKPGYGPADRNLRALREAGH